MASSFRDTDLSPVPTNLQAETIICLNNNI